MFKKLRTAIRLAPNLASIPTLESKLDNVISQLAATSLQPVAPPPPDGKISANPENWGNAQSYELIFWRDHWPYRDLPTPELQTLRHGDAVWFLNKMGFEREAETAFEGFTGSVLEVGCGPIGFFELMENVKVTAQDTLMDAYATLPYSVLGERGAAEYTGKDVADITAKFDFVVCSNMLDHTSDWIRFLVDCRNRVKKGGELLIVTDSRGSPMEGHTQIFSPQQLRQLLELLGAKKLLVDETDRVTDGHCDYRSYVRAAF